MNSLFPYLGVLVIERDPMNRLVTEEMLYQLGFRGIHAEANSDHLAQILEAMQVDIAVIDEAYPEALTKIRRFRTNHYILLIATAENMEPTGHIKVKQAGADAVIPKTFSRNLLLRTITEAMNSENGRRTRIVPFPKSV
ncbi:MAG TPA: response regulator [Beijerinckiaceae bacterium]|jgi:CheY-like chemotaxis protein|nr:response regulator [Beijerinckiaceae bacterium]